MAAIIAQITRAKRERDKKKTYQTEKCMCVTSLRHLHRFKKTFKENILNFKENSPNREIRVCDH